MTTRAAVLSILSLSLFLFFLLPPLDPDLGWHLRCGQEIWRGNLFCHRNNFSLLLAGYEWPNHFWLYEAILYPVYELAGRWGMTIMGSLITSGSFLLLYFALKGPDWAKLTALPVMVFLSWGVLNLGVRGQIAGFFFFCLTLYLLSVYTGSDLADHLRGRRKVDLLRGGLVGLVMMIWANTHGSVVLGVILLGAFGFREFQKRNYRFAPGMLVYPASGLMTLANPFGWRIYEDAWRHFAGVKLASLIAEWVPPPPGYQAIILATVVFVAGLVLTKRKKSSIWQIPLLLAFAVAALKARRQVPHFTAISAFLIFENFGDNLRRFAVNIGKTLTQTVLIVFFGAGLLVNLPQTMETNASWENFCHNRQLIYPDEAVTYLRSQNSDNKNLYNRYEWGGFLVWQLPEYKVFVDGRMPAWKTPSGKSPYTIYLEVLQSQPGWEKTLAEYDIGWILISPGTFMDLLLAPEPEKYGWKEVFRDQSSVIYSQF